MAVTIETRTWSAPVTSISDGGTLTTLGKLVGVGDVDVWPEGITVHLDVDLDPSDPFSLYNALDLTGTLQDFRDLRDLISALIAIEEDTSPLRGAAR